MVKTASRTDKENLPDSYITLESMAEVVYGGTGAGREVRKEIDLDIDEDGFDSTLDLLEDGDDEGYPIYDDYRDRVVGMSTSEQAYPQYANIKCLPKEMVKQVLEEDGSKYQYIRKEDAFDETLLQIAVKTKPHALAFAETRLHEDKNLIRKLVKINPEVVKYIKGTLSADVDLYISLYKINNQIVNYINHEALINPLFIYKMKLNNIDLPKRTLNPIDEKILNQLLQGEDVTNSDIEFNLDECQYLFKRIDKNRKKNYAQE